MARNKNFDRQEKLIQAMELFWQKGYANTSVADLVEHLGINRFSLYSTYTDKETLFHESLQYYLQHLSSANNTPLSDRSSGIDELIAFFQNFTQQQRQQPCGCFFQNSLLERVNEDDSILVDSDAYYENLAKAFTHMLTNSIDKGQLQSDLNVTQLSDFLIIHMQGIRLMGKARQYERLESTVAMLIDWLNSYRT